MPNHSSTSLRLPQQRTPEAAPTPEDVAGRSPGPDCLSRERRARRGRGWLWATALSAPLWWLVLVALLDGEGALGVASATAATGATWLVLGVLCWRAPRLLLGQVGVVVVYALLIEWVFAAHLGMYEYAAGGVPGYVAPGHGMLYLSVLAGAELLGRWRHARMIPKAAAGLALALGGLAAAGAFGRADLLGGLWGLCLAWFCLRGRAPLLYALLLPSCAWLEFLGTRAGLWEWAARDTISGLITIGNPPTVSAGGYAFLAAAALGWAARMRARSEMVATVEALAPTPQESAASWTPPTT